MCCPSHMRELRKRERPRETVSRRSYVGLLVHLSKRLGPLNLQGNRLGCSGTISRRVVLQLRTLACALVNGESSPARTPTWPANAEIPSRRLHRVVQSEQHSCV